MQLSRFHSVHDSLSGNLQSAFIGLEASTDQLRIRVQWMIGGENVGC